MTLTFLSFSQRDYFGTGVSLVLHLLFFLSTGLSMDFVKLSVDSGLSALEIHKKASPSKSENIEITLADNFDSDFVVNSKKKKKIEIQQVVQKTKIANGKSTETIQSEKAGALTEAKPAYLKNPVPVYPASAKNSGQQGLVEILVDVNSDGSVKQIKMKKSSGFLLLDDAAVRAVKNWEFMPASQNGVQIESQVEIPIRFKLAKGGISDIVVH